MGPTGAVAIESNMENFVKDFPGTKRFYNLIPVDYLISEESHISQSTENLNVIQKKSLLCPKGNHLDNVRSSQKESENLRAEREISFGNIEYFVVI